MILVVAAAAGLLGLANTLAVSVLSRTREIGMLRSVGTTRKQVRRLVLVEAITLAIVAFVLAVPLGFVINLGSAAAFTGAIGASIEPTQPWGALPFLLVLTLGVAALASLLPARRAGRLEPSPPSASTDGQRDACAPRLSMRRALPKRTAARRRSSPASGSTTWRVRASTTSA